MEHFVYLSVAHPAPMMKAYIEVRVGVRGHAARQRDERHYSSGPGIARPRTPWPYAIMPFYWLLGALPATRARSATPRTGYVVANDRSAGTSGGKSGDRGSYRGGTRDSQESFGVRPLRVKQLIPQLLPGSCPCGRIAGLNKPHRSIPDKPGETKPAAGFHGVIATFVLQ